MSAGVVGALAYTFCDSFWYSAVEGEVYASSAFFTALVFWAILKWEQNADKPGSDKWIIFIFYMMGLSIGVHLLNLLTIPAIVMVYYFKRYKPTTWGTIIAFVIGCAITGIVQKFVIQYTIKGAGAFDIFFVNSMACPSSPASPFSSSCWPPPGRHRHPLGRPQKILLPEDGLWSAAFMLLGYSTYFTTMIRSNADPGVDMYNVDNPVSLVGYLSRDQYGDWPILYGPDFQDQRPGWMPATLCQRQGEIRSSRQEICPGLGQYPLFASLPAHVGRQQRPGEVDTYRRFSGMEPKDDNPTMADNIKYFISYQNWEMFLRYFMWNFSGKQNDLQGFGNPRDGNAITGIPFIDNFSSATKAKCRIPSTRTTSPITGCILLPLILGLIGLVFQLNREPRGLPGHLPAVLLHRLRHRRLPQPGRLPAPRTGLCLAGACYAFAIWIGLGVIWVAEHCWNMPSKARPAWRTMPPRGFASWPYPCSWAARNGTTMTAAKRPGPGHRQRLPGKLSAQRAPVLLWRQRYLPALVCPGSGRHPPRRPGHEL
jgi:hypothetical protein